MKLVKLAVASALLVTAGAASAQSTNDARCIILSNVFAHNAQDADAKKAAEASLYFYLGRIADSANPTQLKALLDAQAKTITDATAGNLMDACVKPIQAKVQLLQSFAPAQPAAPAAKKPEGR